VLDEALAELLVGVHDDLPVGTARELVAGSLEAGAQLDEAIDLAVEDRDELTGLAAVRLATLRNVDDGEAADGEAHVLAQVVAVLVRAPVLDRGRHGLEHLAAVPSWTCEPGNSAHHARVRGVGLALASLSEVVAVARS
jgi:hypothetical protein